MGNNRLAQVFDAGLGCFAHDDLQAVVAGLSGGVFLATADDFAIDGHMIETVLAGLEE